MTWEEATALAVKFYTDRLIAAEHYRDILLREPLKLRRDVDVTLELLKEKNTVERFILETPEKLREILDRTDPNNELDLTIEKLSAGNGTMWTMLRQMCIAVDLLEIEEPNERNQDV